MNKTLLSGGGDFLRVDKSGFENPDTLKMHKIVRQIPKTQNHPVSNQHYSDGIICIYTAGVYFDFSARLSSLKGETNT